MKAPANSRSKANRTYPQKNFTIIANEALEDLFQCEGLPHSTRVLLFLVRVIPGFGKKQDEISLDQISGGIHTRNWSIPGTNIPERNLPRVISPTSRIQLAG
jgi:hypothetical protein